MADKLRTENVKDLFEAILTLQNVDECYAFFEDVCTVNELISLAQRFEVAGMLRKKHTYNDIAEKTGAMEMTVMKWFSHAWNRPWSSHKRPQKNRGLIFILSCFL